MEAVYAAATMEVVEMVLTGRVNKSLVTLIQQAGGRAVGLCGKDSNILRVRSSLPTNPPRFFFPRTSPSQPYSFARAQRQRRYSSNHKSYRNPSLP